LGRQNSSPVDSGGIYKASGIFRSRELVGKSATQVGRAFVDGKRAETQIVNSDSETYEKWSQAIASANELIARSGHSSLVAGDTVNAAVIFPIFVVPNDTLWAADYSADGQLIESPQKVKECTLFLRKNVVVRNIRYQISHLLLFTKSAFEEYLNKLRDPHSDDWEYLFPDNETFVRYEREGILR
jgi:hypothetical protein